jgi:hypothetical protein
LKTDETRWMAAAIELIAILCVVAFAVARSLG